MLAAEHLRYQAQRAPAGVLHCFVLDCSASMLRGEQLALAKGWLASMFDQAAQQRAMAALICFGGQQADLRFGPAVPRWWNERWLAPLTGGGGTPLRLALHKADALLARAARLHPAQQRHLWLLTDGRSTETPSRPSHADEIHIVDFETGPLRLGRCATLRTAWKL
ncbi:VWA domain-containing protein [Silvimonas sp. JCM 19000]